MAFENEEALNVLNSVTPKGDESAITVDDISNYTPQDLSPQQKQAFVSQYQPAIGAQSPNTYYPDLGHNVAVGGYSGSEIGSATLFAPGGGLVPLGLLDARDLAIQNAAMKKAKDLEDFNKKYQSPTTKHTAVQKELTDSYFSGLNKWMSVAKQKAGGDQTLANKMLQNDPKFQQWNKGMQDRAKLHDQGVEIAANLSVMEKDPNMVLSPATRKAKEAFMSGEMYAGADPFSEQGNKFTKNFLAMQAAADMDVATNKALDKAIPDIEQMTPEQMKAAGLDQFIGRGKHEIASFFEKEYFKPERIKDMAHNLYMSQYQGTGFTEADVLENLQSKVGEKIKRKTEGYDKYFKPDSSGSPTYDANAVVSESAENVVSKGKVVNSYTEKFVPTNATDQKKSLKFAISKDMTTADGSKIDNKTGYIEGNVQGIGVKPYYKKEKRYLTDDEVKVMKERGTYETTDDIEMKPVVVFNLKEKKDNLGRSKQETVYFDTEKVAGMFKDSKSKGKDYESMRQLVESHAQEGNAKRKPTETKKDWSKYKRS